MPESAGIGEVVIAPPLVDRGQRERDEEGREAQAREKEGSGIGAGRVHGRSSLAAWLRGSGARGNVSHERRSESRERRPPDAQALQHVADLRSHGEDLTTARWRAAPRAETEYREDGHPATALRTRWFRSRQTTPRAGRSRRTPLPRKSSPRSRA